MSRSSPSTAATPSKVRTRRSVVIADMTPSSAPKPATIWPVFSIVVSSDVGAGCDSSASPAVCRRELGADAREMLAELRRVDDLERPTEPGDLARQRLDVMPAQLQLDAAVGAGGPDAHAVAEHPPAHRHDVRTGPRARTERRADLFDLLADELPR